MDPVASGELVGVLIAGVLFYGGLGYGIYRLVKFAKNKYKNRKKN